VRSWFKAHPAASHALAAGAGAAANAYLPGAGQLVGAMLCALAGVCL
jgi:hypothetical protein